MKYLPMLVAASAVAVFAGCAAQPNDQFASVGKSANAPQVVSQCIAQQWANATQTPIVSQTIIANNYGVDVLLPGQQPGGDAAIVRPAGSGTWVGYRSSTGASPTPAVTAGINACL